MTAPLQGLRVLIVEDEYLVASLIEEVLEFAGCIVSGPIPRLAEALDAAGREAYDAAVLDINLKGACFCAQAVARVMVAAGRPGAVINLTSGAAFRSSPRGVHYVASKGGVLSMTRAMALELLRTGSGSMPSRPV